MHRGLDEKFNIDVPGWDKETLEESVCDLYGSAIRSYETGIDLQESLHVLSDKRMRQVVITAIRLGDISNVHCTTPVLDAAASDFLVPELTELTADPQLLIRTCLEFVSKLYNERDNLFYMPQNITFNRYTGEITAAEGYPDALTQVWVERYHRALEAEKEPPRSVKSLMKRCGREVNRILSDSYFGEIRDCLYATVERLVTGFLPIFLITIDCWQGCR